MRVVQPLRSVDDMWRVLDAAAGRRHGLRNRALLLLGFCCGRRVGDLLALRVRDVVAGTGKRWQVVKRLIFRERKTGKIADIAVAPVARAALRDYLRERQPQDLDEPLFISQERATDGGVRALTRSSVEKLLRAAGQAAGLDEAIATHSMRKTFGRALFKSTGDITLVMKLLNHRDPGVTLAYIGITRDNLDAAVLAFGIDIQKGNVHGKNQKSTVKTKRESDHI